jgi:hypothetical protein
MSLPRIVVRELQQIGGRSKEAGCRSGSSLPIARLAHHLERSAIKAALPAGLPSRPLAKIVTWRAPPSEREAPPQEQAFVVHASKAAISAGSNLSVCRVHLALMPHRAVQRKRSPP